jgi:hypothetical protein
MRAIRQRVNIDLGLFHFLARSLCRCDCCTTERTSQGHRPLYRQGGRDWLKRSGLQSAFVLFNRFNLSPKCCYAIQNYTKKQVVFCSVVEVVCCVFVASQDQVRTVKPRVRWVEMPGRKWRCSMLGWVVGGPWAAICKTVLLLYQRWRQLWRMQEYNGSHIFVICTKVLPGFNE